MTISVRKKVRFPGKRYRYVYCKHKWREIPPPGDDHLEKFMVRWGEGSYHFIDSTTGKLVSTTSGDGVGYRCVADSFGNPRNYKEEYQKQQERAEVDEFLAESRVSAREEEVASVEPEPENRMEIREKNEFRALEAMYEDGTLNSQGLERLVYLTRKYRTEDK